MAAAQVQRRNDPITQLRRVSRAYDHLRCKYCKKLAPKYEEVAAAFRHDGRCGARVWFSYQPVSAKRAQATSSLRSVVVAKMDATQNDVEGLAVKKFPTIRMFKKGAAVRDGLLYSGDMSVENITSFVKRTKSFSINMDEL